jgi:hypothetical protein
MLTINELSYTLDSLHVKVVENRNRIIFRKHQFENWNNEYHLDPPTKAKKKETTSSWLSVYTDKQKSNILNMAEAVTQ